MQKRHELIPSPSMGRRMHVWCYGHFGTPLMVFPSAAGFAHEWDAQSMVTTLAPLINGGKIKLYCPESNVSQAWTNKEEHPAYRAKAHLAYEEFIMGTLIPWIRRDCHSPRIRVAVTGCSLGGLYAALFALKFPETFHYALCLSGRYNARHFTRGFSNEDIYFNDPLAFVPNLEGPALDRVRNNTHVTLVCGRGAFEEGCIEETILLGRWLQMKKIPNFIDIWGEESRHDWKWWKRQVVKHLHTTFG